MPRRDRRSAIDSGSPQDDAAGISRRVLLAGSTGLVGGHVQDRLASRPDVMLESPTRRGDAPSKHGLDFERLVDDPSLLGDGKIETAICCLGTTLRRAGSPDAFRRVDHDYVVAFARAAKHRHADHFILVSSVGAGGVGLYLRVKAEAEQAVASLGFDRLDIIRPGLLLGNRTERRPAERFAQILSPLLAPALVGRLARYAPVQAEIVARAIALLTRVTSAGHHIHHGPEICDLAQQEVSASPD